MPAPLGLLLSPQSCCSLLFKYLWSGTMAEIFCHSTWSNQHDSKQRLSSGQIKTIELVFPFFRPSSSFEEQTCRRLLDQKEKGFQVLKSTAAIVPTMVMEMFSRAAYAISALYLIYGSLFGCHLAVFYSYLEADLPCSRFYRFHRI